MSYNKIITSEDFSTQKLYVGDKNKGFIANPIKSIYPEFFEGLDREKQLLIGYGNTVVLPYDNPLVSFGHFLLAKTLSELNIDSKEGKKIVDLGTGSGFMGNYLSKNFNSLTNGELVFTDLSTESANAVIGAYLINHNLDISELDLKQTENQVEFIGNNNTLIKIILVDVNETLKDHRADLSVASPVFIPGVQEVFPQAYSVFGKVAKKMSSEFYFSSSSMADNVILEASKNIGGKLEELVSLEMPIEVTRDYRHLDYMKNLGLRETEKGFVHDLKVSKITFN